MEEYFLQQNKLRNYALFILGINTALRISDLLTLKWEDVYDFQRKEIKKHIVICEQKTNKWNCIAINKKIKNCLDMLLKEKKRYPEEYLFQSRKKNNRAITRNQAYIIIKQAANRNAIYNNISCHSLRKTFGYHAWKRGIPPAVIMDIYNHSNMAVTKRYLSIDQDERDEVFYTVEL